MASVQTGGRSRSIARSAAGVRCSTGTASSSWKSIAVAVYSGRTKMGRDVTFRTVRAIGNRAAGRRGRRHLRELPGGARAPLAGPRRRDAGSARRRVAAGWRDRQAAREEGAGQERCRAAARVFTKRSTHPFVGSARSTGIHRSAPHGWRSLFVVLVPFFVRRPLAAPQARRPAPLVPAARASAAGRERVPLGAAGVEERLRGIDLGPVTGPAARRR